MSFDKGSVMVAASSIEMRIGGKSGIRLHSMNNGVNHGTPRQLNPADTNAPGKPARKNADTKKIAASNQENQESSGQLSIRSCPLAVSCTIVKQNMAMIMKPAIPIKNAGRYMSSAA